MAKTEVTKTKIQDYHGLGSNKNLDLNGDGQTDYVQSSRLTPTDTTE